MLISISLVVFALDYSLLAICLPIASSQNGFNIQIQLNGNYPVRPDGLQSRILGVDSFSCDRYNNELNECSVLEIRAKIPAETQKLRKQQAITQANVRGKAKNPVSATKQVKGMMKQKATNGVRENQNTSSNQEQGYTTAAAQQRVNAATNGWPGRQDRITNNVHTVSGKDVGKAVFESNKHLAAGTQATSGHAVYPHTFYNFPNRIRAGTNPHLDYAGAGPRGKPLNMVGVGKEFPVTNSPAGYTGGRPGAMRVITQDGEYKGVLSHDPSRHPSGNDLGYNDLFRVI